MPLRPAIFCALLLAGCAAHTEVPVPKAQAVPQTGSRGTILAMRPVPAETSGPARILLSSLAAQNAPVDEPSFEFIVRTESGTTISIVQPQTNGLHPGERVSILHGTETRIDAPAND
jgi:outer membrane lipoprotein SlyB